jgi:hypothetical protein
VICCAQFSLLQSASTCAIPLFRAPSSCTPTALLLMPWQYGIMSASIQHINQPKDTESDQQLYAKQSNDKLFSSSSTNPQQSMILTKIHRLGLGFITIVKKIIIIQ